MPKMVSYIQVPSNLPDHVDPQIRNFLAGLQIELRGWADEVTRSINDLLAASSLAAPLGTGDKDARTD
jgi:hypothetical protein